MGSKLMRLSHALGKPIRASVTGASKYLRDQDRQRQPLLWTSFFPGEVECLDGVFPRKYLCGSNW